MVIFHRAEDSCIARGRDPRVADEEIVVTVRRMKAARALLGWSQGDLSNKFRVSLPTIGNLEQDEGLLGGREDTR
jgi:hypothetical protein